ncbi:MAG: 8-hydroxy-5-deazaflavin:NADPH oxidoreductase, partial [Mycobacterium sp.]|nr:8-hydroxy-5-deazaflavin:NADPH oxidoreductase [Mycobacterium sp.]
NPLEFSQGFPPNLFVNDTDSLGEQIQRAFPDTRVVKALNTMVGDVMTTPSGTGSRKSPSAPPTSCPGRTTQKLREPFTSDHSTESVLAFYRAAVATANRTLRSAPLSSPPVGQHGQGNDEPVTDLRFIVLHDRGERPPFGPPRRRPRVYRRSDRDWPG